MLPRSLRPAHLDPTLRPASAESLNRVKELSGKADDVDFFEVDLMDKAGLETVFKAHAYDQCIHFAALKVRPTRLVLARP